MQYERQLARTAYIEVQVIERCEIDISDHCRKPQHERQMYNIKHR